jgi:hypothetical protein
MAIDCDNPNGLAVADGLQHGVDRVDFITTNNIHTGIKTCNFSGAKPDTYGGSGSDYISADDSSQ